MGVSTRNWAGNQRCVPAAVHQPASTEEVASIVRPAAEAGRRVKAIGGGHSFTDAAMTDGDLISLSDVVSPSRIVEKAIAFALWVALDNISEVHSTHDMPDDPDVGSPRRNYWA